MPKRFALSMIVLIFAVSAVAQSPFSPWEARGQLRAAVVHEDTGRIYAAAYDRDEVWVLDPASGERLAQIPVGEGPVAVALSEDGAWLAVVNRLEGTLSLIALPSETVALSLSVGDGASSVTSLGGGRFAVCAAFSNTVMVVDAASGRQLSTLPNPPMVPVAVAASGAYLAVLGQAQGAVNVYATTDWSLKRTLSLKEPVKALAGMGKGAFLLGSGEELQLVSGETGTILAKRGMAVSDLAVDGAKVYVLSEKWLNLLNADLTEEAAWSVVGAPLRLCAGSGFLLTLDPRAKQYQVWNSGGLTLKKVEPVVAAAPAEVVIVEARDSDATPESVPVTEKKAPVAEPAPASSAQATEETSAPVKTKTSHKVSRHPANTSSMGAPSPRNRPDANPMKRVSARTITDALLQPTEFGAPGSGFVVEDWTQPLEDIRSDQGEFDFDKERHLLEGNVHLRLGAMLFESDLLSFPEAGGEYFAQGNVRIDQETSSISADEILYTIPLEEELPVMNVVDDLNGQEKAKRRLTLGRVSANNVHVVEPTRELHAKHIEYDFAHSRGELLDARGKAGMFYYRAGELHVHGPDSLDAEDVWFTTCDRETPHYKVRVSKVSIENGEITSGRNARLQLGKMNTPLFLPGWRQSGVGFNPWSFDFDSGRRADIGYYVNVGQQYRMSPYLSLGPRIFVTEKEGVGLGGDVEYDFSKNPASRLFRSKGEIHGFHTTKDRGYIHWQHRYEHSDDLVVRAQAEQWSEDDFYRDFFFDRYKNRTTPRTFANVTYRRPTYVATGTMSANTHHWVRETERLPEGTFHLLERPLGSRFYFAFDTVNGYNDRQTYGSHAARTSNVARLTYDWDVLPALSLTPFTEAEGTWYSRERREDESAGRLSLTSGVTAQSRFHRDYGGFGDFSAFKHLVLPSLTYSYRPETSLAIQDTPHFDALDSVFGRSRIETKIDNIIFGRDSESGEVWQVGRLSLFQGNDFWNETRKADDYEVEIDIRPRPWWGWQLAGERHQTEDDFKVDTLDDFGQRIRLWYEEQFNEPLGSESVLDYSGAYGDYDRILTQLYYDKTLYGGNVNGRVGFAYTGTDEKRFNREVLYGAGYRWEKWGLGFEHRYDFESDELRSQTYELRRSLHCWDMSLRFRDRETGFDVDVAFNISAFPGSRLQF
jgi:YVTN family beta-propeller protein